MPDMKICRICQQTLPITAFGKKLSCTDGYETLCRKCRTIRYNKSTPQLLCKKIYRTQTNSSVKRDHPLPAYSLEEFTTWVLQQPTFSTLYTQWQASNYKKDLVPSVDRIVDALPYIITNLQLMTWEENRAKGGQAKANNTLLVNHRPVVAYNKDGSLYKEYLSMAEAMREFGRSPVASWGIASVCNGVPVKDGRGSFYMPKTYKGYTWAWA